MSETMALLSLLGSASTWAAAQSSLVVKIGGLNDMNVF